MIKRNGDNVFAIASSNNQCQGARGAAVSLSPGSGAATRIPRATTARMTPPDAHHNTKEANIALSTYVEKWKNKYEEAERKHKTCLLKAEKAKREHDDLQRRHRILEEERVHLSSELRERERELAKLRLVSEKLFQEYQQLKSQHEVDTGVMHKVMAQAGEWYAQNKQLKRRSTALLHALPPNVTDIDLTDSNTTGSDASSNEEVEFLQQTVASLSREVAQLQAELSTVKLHEFEAHEAHAARAQELEECQARCSQQESELVEARSALERHQRVSKLLVEEVTSLRQHADNDRHMAETYKSEARDAKKRVKLLTHQSTLLLGEMTLDERMMLLLREVEELKEALEEQEQRHRDQLEDLQLKLAEKHEDTDILLWEEKIKLAEEDSQKALERAEKAERRLTDAERKASEAERAASEAERKLVEAEIRLTCTDKKLIETEFKLTETAKRVESTKPTKRSNLMSRISYFENGASKEEKREEKKEEKIEEVKEGEIKVEEMKEVVSAAVPTMSPPPSSSPPPTAPPPVVSPPPPPPPPPSCAPPPPPPPPPPAVFTGEGGDMASLLAGKQGTLRRTKQNGEAPGGAIDAIVDQIKGGKFHLKSSGQKFLDKPKEETQPEAVKEMLAILGTLRKRRSGGGLACSRRRRDETLESPPVCQDNTN